MNKEIKEKTKELVELIKKEKGGTFIVTIAPDDQPECYNGYEEFVGVNCGNEVMSFVFKRLHSMVGEKLFDRKYVEEILNIVIEGDENGRI